MFAYAARRLLATVPLFLLATLAVFWLVNEVGDPRDRLATCATCDQSAYDDLVELYNLEDPVPVRWANWLGAAVTGDMGEAISQGNEPVMGIVRERAKNTALIAVPAFLLTVVVALGMSVWSAIRQYRASDYFMTGVSFIGIAIPTFVLGLALQTVMLWSLKYWDLKPFYVSGMRDDSLLEFFRSSAMPIFTLAFISIGAEARFGRAAMLEVIGSDHIRTARAKGLAERTVIMKHALRNGLVTFVTVWALDFAALVGGALITETVFNWPGLGRLLIGSLFAQDIHLAMAAIFFISGLAIVCNLLADLLYGVIDPRIRFD